MPNVNEFISHTADIRLKVKAETLTELFKMSLDSMNSLLAPGFKKEEAEKEFPEKIEITSPDRTSLLIDFLSEVLTLSHIHKAVFHDFTIDKMNDCSLSGELAGTRVDGFDEDIKAVTYHEAEVKLNDNGEFETIIIFDI